MGGARETEKTHIGRGKRDWAAIKTEYITTGTSYGKLARKYGVSESQVSRIGVRENWVKLRRDFLSSTVDRAVSAAGVREADRLARLLTVSDVLVGKIEAFAQSEIPLNERGLRSLTAALKDLKEIQGIRNELDRQEQQARIRNLQQKQQEHPDTIQVVFQAGEDSWNE